MESQENSLIKISGEDNSLLHQSHPDEVSGFDLSPFQFPRSHHSSHSGKKSIADSRALGSPPSQSNKENLSTIDNRSGIRNLSVERQKMKKSRKAGGYNLRKSLAWDRAFFTEEGVLDPVEVSMISGISCGNSLSVIDEERRDSLSMTSDVSSGSVGVETVERNIVKELQSGAKTNTSSPTLKQNSLTGSHLPISRSSQKLPTARVLNKPASKGSLCSSPMAPSSQKRLLNTGTTKLMARNSKIPRVPLSKHPPLLSTTCIHAPSDGSQLKCVGTTQPAQKHISLKLPSNIKSASKGPNIKSQSISNFVKQSGANTRMDMTCSSSKMDLSANHKARNINKVCNYLQNNPKQNLSVKMPESVDGASRTRVSSHLQSNNGDGSKKDVQVQGIKPSGLRMPSPSMRFFSESNMKSSNIQSSIPTSKNSEAVDHISNFKQIKVRHGSFTHNATSKKRLSSQVTEICTVPSLVDPKARAETIYGKSKQLVVQQRVPLGDNDPQPTNNAECTKNDLNDLDNQSNNENLTSLKNKEKDMKYNVNLCHAEPMNINSVDPIFQQNGYACGSTMSSFIASCPEVQLTLASATNGEDCPTFDKQTSCSSSAMNDKDILESVTDLNSYHNSYTLDADCDPSTSILCEDEKPGDHVGKEHVDVMFDGDLSNLKLDECSIQQDNISNHAPYHENCNFLYEDKSCFMTPKRFDDKEIADVGLMSNHSRTSVLELSDNGVADEQHLSCGHEIVHIRCQHGSSVASSYGSEVTISSNTEVRQVVNDASSMELPTMEGVNTDLNKGIIPKDSSLESNIEISDGVHQVNTMEKVESDIDSLSNPSKDRENPTIQTTDLDNRLSASKSKYQETNAAVDSVLEAPFLINIKRDLPSSKVHRSATLDIRTDKLGDCVSAEEPERTSQRVETSCNMEGATSLDEVDANLKRSTDVKRIIPALNDVPFSDEWLAVIESAGEEILTMKTGAVQHSPPDKSVPEPSPWSPVKRKNYQGIGPFDCTKHTNIQSDQSE